MKMKFRMDIFKIEFVKMKVSIMVLHLQNMLINGRNLCIYFDFMFKVSPWCNVPHPIDLSIVYTRLHRAITWDLIGCNQELCGILRW